MDTTDNISQQEFERIESYILGLMTDEEKKSFEGELNLDPKLRANVKDIKVLLQEVERVSLKESLDEYHSELKATPVVPMLPQKQFNWKPLAIAASVLLLLAVSFWIFVGTSTENEKLFVAYYLPDPGMVTAMGLQTNYEFDRGMVDYKTGDYQAAITRWEKLLAQKPDNDTLNYFLGSAYLAVDDPDQAKSYLEKTTQVESSIFQKEAFWYLGLTEVKAGNFESAKPLLEKSGKPEALELLQKIKK